MDGFIKELILLIKKYHAEIIWSSYWNDSLFRVGNQEILLGDINETIKKEKNETKS